MLVRGCGKGGDRHVHPDPGARPMTADASAGLAALEARLTEDLSRLNYPPANWVPDQPGCADVVVIGGGMCGLTAAFSLLRRGVGNLRILDRAQAGVEGPWLATARMETLRSPKQLTGPAAGMASLTFRAWYEAQFGCAAWEELFRIPRQLWMAYLVWYRRVLALPVENGVDVSRIEPHPQGLQLDTSRGAVIARKVVLATGRDGLSSPVVPDFMATAPRSRWAHSAETIDFHALRGRRVVVVGAGAAAMDNAATALEYGASTVSLVIRRAKMPRINKLMGIGSAGFTGGFPRLPPHWRWRFMHYAEEQQTPAPRNSTLRVSRHPNASFHFGCPITRVDNDADELRVVTPLRDFTADFMILCTGFTVDIAASGLLGDGDIATWGDRYVPPPELASTQLARFPYLGPSFEFLPREPGAAPWLKDVHCFNHTASLSLGKVSGDIPRISEGADWLADAIAGSLFVDDIEVHWQGLLDYARPELLGDEWQDAEGQPT